MTKPNEKEAAVQDIYRAIMLWLEQGHGPLPGTTRQMLRIEPWKGGPPLLFRRIDMLSERVAAESVKDPRVRISYDPNWAALDKIRGLLEEEAQQQ